MCEHDTQKAIDVVQEKGLSEGQNTTAPAYIAHEFGSTTVVGT